MRRVLADHMRTPGDDCARSVPASSLRGDTTGKPLSPREWEALAAYAEHTDQRQTAAALGVSFHTTRKLLASAYRKLDVAGALEAFRVIGWLRVPEGIAA